LNSGSFAYLDAVSKVAALQLDQIEGNHGHLMGLAANKASKSETPSGRQTTASPSIRKDCARSRSSTMGGNRSVLVARLA
jgi:hypothetical protein